MDSREYFIYLVSCHINTVAPQGEKDISWREIFTLSEKHNLTPIITEEIKLLPREFRPDGNILSSFEMSYDKSTNQYFQKLEALSDLVATLSSNEIPHLIVSGIIINNFYPNAEIRVNSETNVVLKPLDFFDAIDFLRRKGFKVDFFSNNATYLNYKGEIFEITNELESINIQSKIYFSTPFDDISESNGYTYKLKPDYHLLYIITHIAHHLQIGEATVKMISDLDGIIRANPEINIRQFISLCDNIKLKNTALSILALAKKWFDTPIVIDLTFADRSTQPLYETLSSAIIEGCVFGSDSAIKNNIKMSFFEKIIDRIKRFFMRLFSGGRMNIDKTPVRVRGGEFSEYERIIFKELSIKQRQKR